LNHRKKLERKKREGKRMVMMYKENCNRKNHWGNIEHELAAIDVVDEDSYERDVRLDYSCNKSIVPHDPKP
jgi:hypothetical protein